MMEKHIEILETILNGVHPITHEVLSREHTFNDPVVIRALYSAIKAMKFVNDHNEEVERIVRNTQLERKWTEEEDRALIGFYHQELNSKEIAIMMNRAPKAIDERIRYLEGAKRRQNKEIKNRLENAGASWTREDEKWLVKMFNERKPISEIAAVFGRTSGAIRSRMKKLGLIDNKGQYVDGLRPFRKKDNELLRTMYESGLSIELMASRFEVSEAAIRSRLFYMGITKEAPKVLPDRNGKNEEKKS